MRRPALAGVAAAAVLVCAACAAGWDRIPARGEVAGDPVATTVDSPLARAYLEEGPAAVPADGTLERLLAATGGTPDSPPESADFAALAEAASPDLATLHLIERLATQPANLRLRRTFEGHLERVRTLSQRSRTALAACVDAAALPPVWLVPGWFYVTQPGTGADFGRQRRLLDRLGVAHRLLPTVENGTVEENAAIIAEEVRALGPDDGIVLVSVSKGGPEAAHALGRLLDPEETRPVDAWINIGGLLRGTPLADFATSWPVRWLAPFYFRSEGLDPADSVPSLTTGRSRARFAEETIPDGIMLINFTGIPLSGHISTAAEFGYGRMRGQGPNDGLTLIPDALAHGGRTIVQVGLDHYYRDPDLDLKTVALALTVTTELGRALPEACAAGGADHGSRDRPRSASASTYSDHSRSWFLPRW